MINTTICAPIAGLASEGQPKCKTVYPELYNPPDRPSKAPPFAERINQLQIDHGPIQQGYGEYIVFQQSAHGTTSPEKDLFARAYQVTSAHAPYAMTLKEPIFPGMLYKILSEKIREIDPSLEVAFIPRTLYDTFLIRKCIEEDVKNKSVCRFAASEGSAFKNLRSFKEDQAKYQAYLEASAKERAERKCWHLCCFENSGKNADPEVQELAFRINQEMVKVFAPRSNGFTYPELAAFTEQEISFLQNHHKNGSKEIELDYENGYPPTLSLNFRLENERMGHKPMGIRDQKDAQIIREALALECSKLAQSHLFLFRAATFTTDAHNVRYQILRSLSYGTSLFAGSLFDPTAAVMYYQRTANDIFVIAIPYDQILSCPFKIPAEGAIVQFCNRGEFWHGRMKGWSGHNVKDLTGLWAAKDHEARASLQSNLEESAFREQFYYYMDTSIHLGHPDCIKKVKELPAPPHPVPDALRKRIFTSSILT